MYCVILVPAPTTEYEGKIPTQQNPENFRSTTFKQAVGPEKHSRYCVAPFRPTIFLELDKGQYALICTRPNMNLAGDSQPCLAS